MFKAIQTLFYFFLLFIAGCSSFSQTEEKKDELNILKITKCKSIDETCHNFLKNKFNYYDKFDNTEYYDNCKDSSTFFISFGDTSCFFILLENLIFALPEDIPLTSQSKIDKIESFLMKKYKCDSSKEKEHKIIKSIIWQINNGVKSSGYTF